MFTDVYLYLEDMKEKMEDSNQYISILNLEKELTEMNIMIEFGEDNGRVAERVRHRTANPITVV